MSILIKPRSNISYGVYQRITPEISGWLLLFFEALLFKKGPPFLQDSFSFSMVLLFLLGIFTLSSYLRSC